MSRGCGDVCVGICVCARCGVRGYGGREWWRGGGGIIFLMRLTCHVINSHIAGTGGSASFTTSRRSRAPLTITATLVSGNTRTLVREVKTGQLIIIKGGKDAMLD